VRVKGKAPTAAAVYELEKLRCNLCGDVFYRCRAGKKWARKKYDETAASMIALLRYGSGFPWYRLEGLQEKTWASVASGDTVRDRQRKPPLRSSRRAMS